jgi:predicted enzyme related to lactoylglutathione lyase
MPPTFANGKICYVEIPAEDVSRSSTFYAAVFGWELRRRGDGATAFDDGVEVGGAWVTGRPPSREAGVLLYVMVADVAATLERVAAGGGEIVERADPGAHEIVARFRDPAGNLVGLYQERQLTESTPARG